MAKGYLNREERNKYLYLRSAHLLAQMAMDIPTLPKEAKTSFKHARTWLEKGVQQWTEPLDFKFKKQLEDEASLYTLTLALNKDASRMAIKVANDVQKLWDEVIEQVGRDPIYDIVEVALNNTCQKCDGSPACSEKGCFLKDAFMKLQIPTWDANDKCPYSRSGVME